MKKYIYLFLSAVLFASTSCSDFLSAYSQDMIVAKSCSDLDEVLLGDVYIKSYQVSTGPSGGRCAGFFNVLDDDLSTGSVGSETSKTWGDCLASIFGYYAWQLRVGSNYNASYFQNDNITYDDLYARINTINVILDEIVDLPHESEKDYATYLRVQGEACFLRAYFYFTLANLYGDAYEPTTCSQKLCVPLKLTPYVEHDKDRDTQFKRATVKEVYDQIISDLTLAEDYLTKSPQNTAHRLHRASVEAVDLLFSRVYLFMQNWEMAEQKADAVINSSYFQLAELNAFEDGKIFLTRENAEVLFSQGPNNLSSENLFTARPGDFCVSRELYDLYDENDRRKSCFFGTHALSDSITLQNKFERGSIVSHISDVFTLRASEAYLNKAEACAMQKSQDKETEACKLLNALRKKRIIGYNDNIYSGEELVQQIRDERRREFCFEAHRWFDLRRYAVCEAYPYSKSIIHVYSACGNNGVSYTEEYKLEEHDKAYTFALPESVIKFDVVPMEDNPREARKALSKKKPGEEGE